MNPALMNSLTAAIAVVPMGDLTFPENSHAVLCPSVSLSFHIWKHTLESPPAESRRIILPLKKPVLKKKKKKKLIKEV